jgi:TolB-like protein/Flp pilus assembly protein TadD
MSRRERQIYSFGAFRIDPEERLLRRGAGVIALPPKAIDTLLALTAEAGRVVSKDDLIRRVWPDTIVEEGGLARNISLLRKALGEDSGVGSEDDQYIETIPRRGYRFVAPVVESTGESNKGRESARALAVLPLANLSRQQDEDFFADGMTDELISHFMRIEALRVVSRTTVMAYKGVAKPLREIARELDVNWVVEGTVLPSGGRVRITVRLIDGETEKHLWAETYEKDLRDVLALQSEVARDIAREIRMKVSSSERATIDRPRPIDPEAYRDYLRGRHFWNKRTTDGLLRARDYFRAAIERDPTYAPAHSGLADAYALLGSTGYDVMPPKEAMPLARAAAVNALRIDDTLAEAHAAIGYVALVYDWDCESAERELRRAIELNPNYATAYQWLGELWMARALPDRATAAFQHALELDPLSIPCNLGLGWSYYFSRDFDLAIAQYRRTLEIAPSVPMALYGLGLAYGLKHLPMEGLSEFRKADASSGGESAAVMLVGVTHALAGHQEPAEQELRRLATIAERKYVPAVYFAFIYVALDDLDRAFEWLGRACEERSTYLVFLNVQPSLDRVRSDPRYQQLLNGMGLFHGGFTAADGK